MSANLSNVAYRSVIRLDVTTDGTPCYIAEHPDLPGCEVHAPTLTEAQSLLASAREAYLTHLADAGLPVPVPGGVATEEVAPSFPDRELARADGDRWTLVGDDSATVTEMGVAV